jgi:hypothetical protein
MENSMITTNERKIIIEMHNGGMTESELVGCLTMARVNEAPYSFMQVVQIYLDMKRDVHNLLLLTKGQQQDWTEDDDAKLYFGKSDDKPKSS